MTQREAEVEVLQREGPDKPEEGYVLEIAERIYELIRRDIRMDPLRGAGMVKGA